MPNPATPNSRNEIGKKVSRVPLVTIASIMLLSNSLCVLAQPQLVAKRVCINEVGRIVSDSDRYLAVGSEICLGDKINPANGSTVKAVCYSSRQVLEFQQSAVFGVSVLPLVLPLFLDLSRRLSIKLLSVGILILVFLAQENSN